MPEYSGANGSVTTAGVSTPGSGPQVTQAVSGDVRNWRVTETRSAPTYRASNTRLGTGRVAGVQDWNGSFEQWGLTPRFWPGDWISFIGYTAPTSSVPGSVGKIYSGDSRVSEVSIRWNWRDNEVPQITTSFEANGGLFEGTGLFQDTSIPNPPAVCGLKLKYFLPGFNDYQEWLNISSVTWTVRAENPVVVNSSSYDSFSKFCYTERLRGPIDFDLDILEDHNHMGLLFLPVTGVIRPIGADVKIKIYVNATEFWAINFARIDGVSDLLVDPETANVIEQTVNLKMQGFTGAFNSGVAQEGNITDPKFLLRWPFTLGV